MKFTTPSIGSTAFNCPYCQAFAQQQWFRIAVTPLGDRSGIEALAQAVRGKSNRSIFLYDIKDVSSSFGVANIRASHCMRCRQVAIWVRGAIVFPPTSAAPEANPDMPEDIRHDYDEAGSILNRSPRGAAALMRLVIQKLCKELGQPGKNINDDIGALVKAGLNPLVQQSLDVVRVIGNNAVHPGQIDLKDDRETAATLFMLLNLIVDKTISEPKRIAEAYATLPESATKAIEKRDKKG